MTKNFYSASLKLLPYLVKLSIHRSERRNQFYNILHFVGGMRIRDQMAPQQSQHHWGLRTECNRLDQREKSGLLVRWRGYILRKFIQIQIIRRITVTRRRKGKRDGRLVWHQVDCLIDPPVSPGVRIIICVLLSNRLDVCVFVGLSTEFHSLVKCENNRINTIQYHIEQRNDRHYLDIKRLICKA